MPHIPLLSNAWDFLTTPSYPRTAVSISEHQLALVSLKRRKGNFELLRLAVTPLASGILQTDFVRPNVTDEAAFRKAVDRLLNQAGAGNLSKVAVALPQGAVRSLIVDVEKEPESQSELEQMLEWKIERGIGARPGELRLSRRRVHEGARVHWFVTAAHHQVMEQYEKLFVELGWHVGLTMPDYLAEARWLTRSRDQGDQVLVSVNDSGFVVVIVRRGEPALVRQVECARHEQEDEFYRMIVFYRDRVLSPGEQLNLDKLLVIGNDDDQSRFRTVLTQAIEAPVSSLSPENLGLRAQATVPFSSFAAAAGLSTFAWTH